MPHRSWSMPDTYQPDRIDVKGVAVAVAFLAAITLFSGGRGEQALEESQPRTAQVDSRPSASFIEQTAIQAQSIPALREAPDERQPATSR